MPKVVPEYKEEARIRILDAARKIFGLRGFHEATMEHIAKHLGVSKGALYLYFRSKEDLFEAMSRTGPNAFKEILYSTFGSTSNPVESAALFFDRMIERFGTTPRLDLEILSEASRNQALRRVLRQNQQEVAKGLAGFLEELKKLKVIDEDLRLLPLAYALIALWNGLETLMVSGLSVEEAKEAWLESFKAIFLQNQNGQLGAVNLGRKVQRTS
jgi:TetR/AcrR family transcriptional regulator, repressor for uid operon